MELEELLRVRALKKFEADVEEEEVDLARVEPCECDLGKGEEEGEQQMK